MSLSLVKGYLRANILGRGYPFDLYMLIDAFSNNLADLSVEEKKVAMCIQRIMKVGGAR